MITLLFCLFKYRGISTELWKAIILSHSSNQKSIMNLTVRRNPQTVPHFLPPKCLRFSDNYIAILRLNSERLSAFFASMLLLFANCMNQMDDSTTSTMSHGFLVWRNRSDMHGHTCTHPSFHIHVLTGTWSSSRNLGRWCMHGVLRYDLHTK